MARLLNEVKIYMIHRNAAFDPPSVVADAVRKQFGCEVSRQTVECYDPTKASGEGLARKWKALFERARAAVLADYDTIGIAHKNVRLRRLDRMYMKAEEMGNMVLAAAILEQAQKEDGDFYTNRRKLEHSNPDGSLAPKAPVIISQADVAEAVKALTG